MHISRASICLVAAAALVALAGCGRSESGIRLTLQVDSKAAKNWPSSQAQRLAIMEQMKTTAERRVSGVTGADCSVEVQGDDKLVVMIHGVNDPQTAANAAGCLVSKGTLELYHLKNVRNRNNPLGEWQMGMSGGNSNIYVFTDPKGQKINSRTQPADLMAQVVEPGTNAPILTGRDLLPNAKATYNQRQQPVILIEFNKAGTAIFRDFTRKNIGEYLAVFYDGKLLTAPTINEPIAGGMAEISGFSSLQEARETAEMLNSGALPVVLNVAKQETVSK